MRWQFLLFDVARKADFPFNLKLSSWNNDRNLNIFFIDDRINIKQMCILLHALWIKKMKCLQYKWLLRKLTFIFTQYLKSNIYSLNNFSNFNSITVFSSQWIFFSSFSRRWSKFDELSDDWDNRWSCRHYHHYGRRIVLSKVTQS